MAKFLDLTGLQSVITKMKAWVTGQLPTKLSELTNDADFQTGTQVDNKINAKMTSVYKYQGSVANYAALPTNDMSADTVGYVYNTSDTGANYAWAGTGNGENGDGWDKLGDTVDLSGYVQKEAGKGLSTNDYTTEEKQKLAGLENYTHATHTAYASGLYKVTVDGEGHVTAAAEVTKEDITNLGIPAQDTTYESITTAEIDALFTA